MANMVTLKDSIPCEYCGLPTHRGVRETKPHDDVKTYCCLGCRIADGLMQGSDVSAANRTALTRLALAIFFTMNVMVFTMVLWTWNVHEIADEARVHAFHEVLRYACLLFSCPVLLLLGAPLVESAWESCKLRIFTTDVLLLAGVVAAFSYSVFSLLFDLPHVYFEVACMILIAVTLGKWLEATAKLKATNALRSLRQLLPETVRRVEHSSETVIPLEAVKINDRLRILAGERIPVDATLVSVSAVIDDQVITGESIPKPKEAGDSLYGGSLNLSGEMIVRATSSSSGGAIARLAEAVESATHWNCRSIRLADRLAAWFAPLIFVVCLFSFAYNMQPGFQHALMSSLSVVLIACPCALGIATPLALWVAINTGARNGVLFRNGDAVMNLAAVRSLAIDKTGTITSGKLQVSETFYASTSDAKTVDAIAKRLATASNHILSVAVYDALDGTPDSDHGDAFMFANLTDCPGKGVSAWIGSASAGALRTQAVLGSVRFALESGMSIPDDLQSRIDARPDLSIVCVAFDKQVQGMFLLAEYLRPEAVEVTRKIKDLGLKLRILTGDVSGRAESMESSIGVETIGELLPEDKSNQLKGMPQPVAMLGDGVNDSLALAVADVGIALDCGADVSRDAADVCLMGNTIVNLPWAIELARATRSTIRRNLVWAVSYNVIGIGFAATGNLNPILAAIAMVASSLFVLVNSLRLQSFDVAGTNRHAIEFDLTNEQTKKAETVSPSTSELLVASP